ncbi:MAG: hypothetical protein ACYDAD_09170 [Acidimicrobiales bacterium]
MKRVALAQGIASCTPDFVLATGNWGEIVALRKELTDLGVDAGAHTIHYHLQRRHRRRRRAVPSVATIWRVLSRRGFVVAQPHKQPKSSWRRFAAELPNECWQAARSVLLLVADRDVRVINNNGELLAEFSIDPGQDLRGTETARTWPGCPGCLETPVRDVSRHNTAPPAGLEQHGERSHARMAPAGLP